MNTSRDEHGTPAGYNAGLSASAGGAQIQQNLKLRNVVDKDVDSLEAFLSSLDSALATSGRRLTEREDELVAQVQAGNSLTFALSYHQFAQNLAVSDQILASNGLDAASEMQYLHKMAINSDFKADESINVFASKAAATSVAEAWEEFKKKRFSQLSAKEEYNMPSNSSINAHLAAKVTSMGQKILTFLQEEIEVLDQVFKEIGPILYLVHSLYHKFYTKQIRMAINLQFSAQAYYQTSRSHSQSNTHSRSSNSHVQVHARSHSQSESQPESSQANCAIEWDEWAILCMEVKNSVSSFAKEASKICGINSSTEFERHFPLLPVFHEACISANDLLTNKISRTFSGTLAVEREAFNQSKTYPSSRIPSRSNFRSYPLISDTSLLAKADLHLHPPISSSAASTIEVLDSVVEFIASMEFRPLIDTFVRSILPAMVTCTNRLTLAARDVPQANDIEFLYISLNTAAALHERLVIYEHVLAPAHGNYFFPAASAGSSSSPMTPISTPLSVSGPTGPSPLSRSSQFTHLQPNSNSEPTKMDASRTSRSFRVSSPPSGATLGFPLQHSTSAVTPPLTPSLSILWECQKMLEVEVLHQSDQLISILVDACCTHIFPNIDMNEWQDHRGFYSDARPSHGIQMLHYYLKSQSRALLNHLKAHCAQYVVAHTLRRCAELLLVRYASISPSRVRSTHYRLDITYLVATIQTLQSACGGWYTKLCMPSMCCTLISLMAVVVAPLDIISSFLQNYVSQKQKKAFLQPPPPSLVIQSPVLEGIIPNFQQELWPGGEAPVRAEVRPIEDMQFLLEKHSALAAYPYNYRAILENCSTEFSSPFLVQLVSNRPELKENIYPPLDDAEKALLPILHDFLRPP